MKRFEILESGEFHIHRVTSEGDKDILSDFEKKRYDSFSSPQSALIYLKSHSAARNLAASYTGKIPSKLEFETEPEGKPFFKCTPNLHFNLSHSGEAIFIVFSSDPVGFDIENKHRKADFLKLARRFFHPPELELMNNSSKPESIAFLELWTAKEAMLKLLGSGISSGLDKAIVLNGEEGIFNQKKIHLQRYVGTDFLGALASFTKIRLVREFIY